MKQQTSLMAYEEFKPILGERQQQLHSLFKENIFLYDQLASHLLGLPINSVTPRRNELEKLGVIIKAGTTMSKYTGKMVNQYRVIL